MTPELLRVEPVREHRWRAAPEMSGDGITRNVVFGGQILAQMIMAAATDRAATGSADKEVKSIHVVFARPGNYDAPIEYDVERLHDGRTFGTDTVTLSQHDKTVARSMILWHVPEPDLIRHTGELTMPAVPGPDDPAGKDDWRVFPGSTAKIVDGIDTWVDDEPVRPAVLRVWIRHPEDLDAVANQAVLSWATDGFLIGTSMLPDPDHHEGQAHRSISTGVVSHTISFHERFAGDEWLLLDHASVYAGRGRVHGRCDVWTSDGRLVATFSQDAIVRAFAGGPPGDPGRSM